VAVKRPDPDTGAFGYSLKTRVRATGAEHGLRRLQHALAIADRIGPGFPNGFCELIGHLTG
jgi:hypothetical protein